jgi:hypothetical protein
MIGAIEQAVLCLNLDRAARTSARHLNLSAICAAQFEFVTGNSSNRNSERFIRMVCILLHLHLLAVHDNAPHESDHTACAVTCVQVAMSRLCLLSVEEAEGHSLCEGRKLH